MESKNLEWIKLLIGFAGSFIGLLLLILFNNLILVTLSQPYKAISAIISYWILALPIIILLLIFKDKLSSIGFRKVMFGMLHLFSGGIVQAVCTSVLGMMFCLFKLKIKNCTTLTLMITHGVYDALIVVITAVVMGK